MGVSHVLQALAAILVLLPQITLAANVITVFPVGSPSHWNLGKAISLGLHARGHRITAVSAFPGQGPKDNWTDVAVPNTVNFFGHTSGLFDLGRISDFRMFMKMIDYGTSSCDVYLQDENVKRLLNSDEKFDVMIMEVFFSECFLVLAHKFKIPVIAFATFSPSAWMGAIVGNPSSFAYVPDAFLSYSDHMTFFERLHNAAYGIFCKMARQLCLLPKQDAVVRRYVNDPTMPTLQDIERNTSLLLTNSHYSVLYPRPLVPGMIEVGGMHVNPPKKLPEDLQTFLDGAKDGAILFSMGSNLKSADLPEEKKTALVNAFSKLKQRVLWKWETETFPGKPDNLKLGKWLPQSDVLAHKNIKLFITHGGLLSTLEAVYHGVPVIGLPIFGDQELNMIQAQKKGYGLRLNFRNITTDTMLWAINEVLGNPRYRRRAHQLSNLFHDRPRAPLDEVVYWTEYVIRHKGAPHMRSAALDLSWYQLYLLDVVVVVIGGAALALWLLAFMLRRIFRLLCSRGSKSAAANGDMRKLKKK